MPVEADDRPSPSAHGHEGKRGPERLDEGMAGVENGDLARGLVHGRFVEAFSNEEWRQGRRGSKREEEGRVLLLSDRVWGFGRDAGNRGSSAFSFPLCSIPRLEEYVDVRRLTSNEDHAPWTVDEPRKDGLDIPGAQLPPARRLPLPLPHLPEPLLLEVDVSLLRETQRMRDKALSRRAKTVLRRDGVDGGKGGEAAE